MQKTRNTEKREGRKGEREKMYDERGKKGRHHSDTCRCGNRANYKTRKHKKLRAKKTYITLEMLISTREKFHWFNNNIWTPRL